MIFKPERRLIQEQCTTRQDANITKVHYGHNAAVFNTGDLRMQYIHEKTATLNDHRIAHKYSQQDAEDIHV